MNNIVIHAEMLSKEYQLGPILHGSIHEDLQSKWARLCGKEDPNVKIELLNGYNKSNDNNRFYALNDVSFDINQGEIVGIIGNNGAGKSTLLKIISRITSPSKGRVLIRGRVASLLEVGTGFHPELSGRENIFLNGALLGMQKWEIEKNFEDIVLFSEISKFIDTPVKRYSSGMYVRLAFAVAAHLNPEILVLDEVLAVGDAEFQKKCLGKMGEVAKEGRTVLFVSHNINAVASLCSRGILLSNGKIIADGSVKSVISKYLESCIELNGIWENQNNSETKKLSIEKISLMNNTDVSTNYYSFDILTVRIEFTVRERLLGPQIALELLSENGTCIFSSTSQDFNCLKQEILPGNYTVDCPIELKIFRKGRYLINISSSIPGIEMLDIVNNSLMFEIINDPDFILKIGQGRNGIIIPLIKWRYYDEKAF